MKKKFVLFVLALALTLSCAAMFAACGETPKKVSGFSVAKTGEQPSCGKKSDSIDINYGEKPQMPFYKLYLHYSDDTTEEVSLSDEKLSVKYSYNNETIENLPTEYLAGDYLIEYTYDNNPDLKVTVSVGVAKAEKAAFSVQPAKSSWYLDEKTPNVILKNPLGGQITQKRTGNDGDTVVQKNDTDAVYDTYYIKKSIYDGFTEEKKTDLDFIYDFFVSDGHEIGDTGYYESDSIGGVPAGDYMLVAIVRDSYNYTDSVAAAPFSVKDPIVERKFDFKSLVLTDGQGNIVTDTGEEDYADMTESFHTANQGNYVICKANGEVRGTVDFGGGPFDEMTGEDVYGYSIGYPDENGETSLDIVNNGFLIFSGKKSGSTLTLKMYIEGTEYIWVMTFTCA